MFTSRLKLMLLSMGAAPCSPISANSSADIEGCSRGVLRPYHAQSEIKPIAGRLSQSNARCHPIADMSDETSGGVRAAPRPSPMVCKPCTDVQLPGGNQTSNTPADTGKIAACEQPSSNCTASNAANKPVPLSQ